MGTLDAPTLRRAMALYAQALEAHREEIDSLNVFPVPDGDTGTNMLLTQRAVDEACAELDGVPPETVGETIARAALLGARGNSGVILSQILRGLTEGMGDEGLAAALVRAHEEARKSVAEPAEGTILTVLGDAAQAAAAADGDPVEEVARVALEAARASLERTPDQLEDLRRAGVVDAGGKGLVLLLDALAAAIEDRPLSEEVGPMGPVGHEEVAGAPSARYGFEVMYVIRGAAEGLRERLAAIGDSVVVVGGEELFQAHVHTDDPGLAVEEGIRTGGGLERIRIVSLDEQVAAHCVAADALREDVAHSLVAVAQGKGMVGILRSLGARVVGGGPSVEDLVGAIEAAPGRRVLLLAERGVAEAAATRTAKEVSVVPTASVAQRVAAASAYLEGDPDPLPAMEAAAAAVRWGEVGPADDAAAAAVDLARTLEPDGAELLALYVGEHASDEDGERVARALREALPHLEIEVHRGDQPGAPYLIGME